MFKKSDLVISCAGRLATVKKVQGDQIYVRALFHDRELSDEAWTDTSDWRLYTQQDSRETRRALDGYLQCAGAR